MSGLRSALGLLTVLPAGGTYAARAAVGWFAPVGLILGLLLSAAAAGAFELWPSVTAAVVVVALGAVLTGGLHLDGLADTADAVLAPVSRERRLEILQDVHHGSFAVVAVAVVLLVKFGALAGMGTAEACALVLAAPVAGRAVILPAIRHYPAARQGGMGAAARSGATPLAIALAAMLAIGAAFAALGWPGVAVGAGVAAMTGAFGAFFSARIGGLTGDTYGALVELAEAGFLLGGSALISQGWAEPFPGGWR